MISVPDGPEIGVRTRVAVVTVNVWLGVAPLFASVAVTVLAPVGAPEGTENVQTNAPAAEVVIVLPMNVPVVHEVYEAIVLAPNVMVTEPLKVNPLPVAVRIVLTGPVLTERARVGAAPVMVIGALAVAPELASVAVALPLVVPPGTVKAQTKAPRAVAVIVEPTNVPELHDVGTSAPAVGTVRVTEPL